VILPHRGDPRLRLSIVIIALQALGQTVLGFKVSIAQILVSIAICAVIEIAVTYRTQSLLAWPASAILTGNSVAFILRASGTVHGDWWSLNGIEYFILASLLAMLSKYLIRPGGRHIYNPSNTGLVVCLLLIGATSVYPQYLWWGGMRPALLAALAVIWLGAFWVLRPVKMVPMAAAFLLSFWVLVAALAAAGHCFVAAWRSTPVCGPDYWMSISGSPEVLIFVFFMMSDPRTAPRYPRARLWYGSACAGVAATLMVFQTTEFGIKVAILASLMVTCSAVPFLDRLGGARTTGRSDWTPGLRRPPQAAATGAWAGFAPVVILVMAVVAGTIWLSGDPRVFDIERGLSSPGSSTSQ
jgi:hypothetical protein